MQVIATETRLVPLKKLVLEKTVQMRDMLDLGAIRDYADAILAGEELPPIIVFYRQGGKMYVADGFHRVKAAIQAKKKEILAEVRDGSRRDAILFAAGANARHGVRRTNNDKRRAVTTLLNDKEWVRWTDTEIARRANVSSSLVVKYRELLGAQEELRQYVDRTGRLRNITVCTPEPTPEPTPKPTAAKKCPTCGQPWPKHLN